MNRPFFSVILFGYLLPGLLAVVIGIACGLEFSFLYSGLKSRLAIYNTIQQQHRTLAQLDEDLKKAENEAEFLDAAVPELEKRLRLGRMDDFLTYLKTSSTRGLKITQENDVTASHFYGEGSYAKTLTIEGFSGPIIGAIGQGLRRCTPIFTDEWSIHALPDKGILEFNVTVVYAPLEVSSASGPTPSNNPNE